MENLSSQTFRDFETIIVDSSTNNKTELVVNRFDKKLPNGNFYKVDIANVSYQRNFGGRKAKGLYFIFFDADVEIGETYLEEIYIAATKKDFSFATTWLNPDSEKSIDSLIILLVNVGIELAKGVNKPFSGGYNTIVKKDVFELLKGFSREIKIGEDHDFAIRAMKSGVELTILKEPRLVMSLRRFRSEGALEVLGKYTKSQIYAFLKGPVTKKLFEYEMGGQAHVIKKKTKLLEE